MPANAAIESGAAGQTVRAHVEHHLAHRALVSLLGPYDGIHLPGIPEEEPVAREIAREIEATYPGYQPIPPELQNEVVPDVTMVAVSMGEATIGMLLFSIAWTFVDPV